MKAKSTEKISTILQKDFIHIAIEKKVSWSLCTNFDSFIKAVNYYYFSLPNLAC